MKKYNSFILLSFIFFLSCDNQKNTSNAHVELTDEFQSYWYAGKAEIASYNLKQSRYGEIHEGHAVLIFVTEDFSKAKQVKLDDPEAAGEDKEKVMKVNFMKNFTTGIYPYSIMMSVFTPVYYEGSPLKLAMSSQEWCGHVFTQMNLAGDNFDVKQYSYFESEGDKNYKIEAVFTEDEIWNRIKLDHGSLPVGEIKIIPGLITTRLLHKDLEPVNAVAELEIFGDTLVYTVLYENQHKLEVSFSAKFPHLILGWEEEFTGLGGKNLTTTATLIDTLVTDYWTKNKNEFLYLRDSLGLTTE